MRIAVPNSLIVVALVRADTDGIVTRGPYSSVTTMDRFLTGRRYPDGDAAGLETIARYDARSDRWFAADGCPLVMLSFGSVDDMAHCGCPEERQKAAWVRSEFPPEEAEAPKEG